MAKSEPEFTLESIGHDVKSILEANKETHDCLFGNGNVGLKIKVDRLVQASKFWFTLKLGTTMAVVATVMQVLFQKWGK